MIEFISPLWLIAIGALGLIVFIIVSWRSMILGLYGLAFLLPSYLIRFKLLSLPTTILEIAIWILFLFWITKEHKKILPFVGARINAVTFILRWLITLLLLAGTISAFISHNQLAAWGLWKAYFLEPAMMFLVFVYTLQTEKHARTVLAITMSWVLLLFPLGLIQMLTGWSIPTAWSSEVGRRITLLYGYPNGASLFIAPLIAYSIGWYLTTKIVWQKWYAALISIIGTLLLFWSHTDGALIALGLCLIAIILYRLPSKFWRFALLALGVCAVIWYGMSSSFQSQWTRIENQQVTLSSSSLEIRIDQWRETWDLLSHNWIKGTGLAAYQQALQPYHKNTFIEIFLYPHNIFLNFWTETGLLGLIIFLALIFWQMLSIWKIKKQIWRLPLLCYFAVLIIHGLVDVPYFRNDLSVLFFVMLAIVVRLSSTVRPLATDNQK